MGFKGAKSPRKVNPKSLANLRPCKKGQVLNPLGAGAGAQNALVRIRRLASPEVAEIGSLILDQNVYELKAIIDDAKGPDGKGNPRSKHSALKVWMATIALRGITKGDPYAMDAILNRVVGKQLPGLVPDETPPPEASVVAAQAVAPGLLLTTEERKARIERYQELLLETEPESTEKEVIDVTPITVPTGESNGPSES